MKEILYLHTGTGFFAAHFFNTLQSYFTYEDDDTQVSTVQQDHDVSFQEGRARNNLVTYTPRAIILDYKRKFGSTVSIDASRLGETADYADSQITSWTEPVSLFQQEPIPKSSYHEFIEDQEDQDNAETDDEPALRDFTSTVSYWTDISRVYYHPRGLCRLPDPPEWERDVGWARGIDRFQEVIAEHDIQDDVFRLFAEECDALQGLQTTTDAVSFGSFSAELLSQLRDEYPKLPILSLCSLSSFDPLHANVDHVASGIYVLNDAMTLQRLASLSCQIIPLQHPSTWNRGPWCENMIPNFQNPCHFSALLSAHIESITLPLRLKQTIPGSSDMSTLISQLNWKNDTPFSAMTGSFSLDNLTSKVKGSEIDFSHPSSLHEEVESLPFAQRAVYRGLDPREKAKLCQWIDETQSGLREPFHTKTLIDTPYPIPSSYPLIFAKIKQSRPERVYNIPLYSSIRTTLRTGKLAKMYAQFVNDVSKRHTGVIEELGIERDVVREAGEDWWKWVEVYEAEEDEKEDIDEDE